VGTVSFKHIIHNTINFPTGPSTHAVKVINFSQQGHQKSSLKRAVELTDLAFYKKKNGFEGAQDVLDFYNKTFKKKSPVETKVILSRASAEVVHHQEMEPFAVPEFFIVNKQKKAP
jgi:hypothetical protein